jgi:predicted ATPase
MRIAVTGTHRTGKTTLVEALGERLRGYSVIEEPYLELEADDFELSHPPTVEDFEAQLRHSLARLEDAPPKAIFDRCPMDFIAYLRALDPDYDTTFWYEQVDTAMHSYDLVVFVPIEATIIPAAHEDLRLRARVDELLRVLVAEDSDTLNAFVEVSGTVEQRIQQVLAAMTT